MNILHGFHVFLDGSAWCAVGPHFIDLMKSDAAFGDTPEEAVSALRAALARDRWWENKPLPTFEEFTVHPVTPAHRVEKIGGLDHE